MSEFLENVSEEVLGRQEETPERGQPGSNPPAEPQPGLHPGAGEGPDEAPDEASKDADESEQDRPAQGFGEPDSY